MKEDDDLTETGEGKDNLRRDGASPQPPLGSGAKRKRKKRKKRGKVRVPHSSEDPTDVRTVFIFLKANFKAFRNVFTLARLAF